MYIKLGLKGAGTYIGYIPALCIQKWLRGARPFTYKSCTGSFDQNLPVEIG